MTRDEDRCATRVWRVERKLRSRPPLLVQPPVGKEMRAEAAAIDCLEKARRNDLVGIHVFSGQHDAARCERSEWLHHLRAHERLRTSAIAPVTAVAAAVSGLARNVRPPLPWRPSKLRLLVLTALSPG